MSKEPLEDVIEFLDNQSLLEAYQETDRSPERTEANALLGEIARRNLDI
ncbi:hypothetical protein U1737_09585 [Sphingomonas sp. LB3N6]